MFRLKNNIIKVVIILVFLISPLVVIIMPLLISSVLFDSPEKIMFISLSKRLIMYLLILIVVTTAILILYFLKSIIVKLLTVIFTILVYITLICVGAMNYLYLDEHYIEFNPLFGPTVTYDWDKLEHVIHEKYNEETKKDEKYIFVFSDGFIIEFQTFEKMNSTKKTELTNKILELEVSFEEY